MDVFDLELGTKVDIRLLQSVAREGRDENDGNYVSGISDIEEDGTILLDMPTRAGKVVLIPMGVRYELIFTMQKRLFKAEAEIVTRLRKGRFSLIKARLTTPIEKFQRREYYRLDCMMPVSFVKLTDEAGEMESMRDIRNYMQHGDAKLILGEGTITNISGGGLRVVTDMDLSDTKYLFFRFSMLFGEDDSRVIALVGQVVGDGLTENREHNAYRVRILYKDSRLQEMVIRFIFEQERRNRRKELGV